MYGCNPACRNYFRVVSLHKQGSVHVWVSTLERRMYPRQQSADAPVSAAKFQSDIAIDLNLGPAPYKRSPAADSARHDNNSGSWTTAGGNHGRSSWPNIKITEMEKAAGPRHASDPHLTECFPQHVSIYSLRVDDVGR
jgi:hypothetical protein